MNLVKVPARMGRCCAQNKLVSYPFPFHWGEVTVTLDRLSQVVEAMADMVLPRRPARLGKGMAVCLGVECLSKLIQTM